MASSLSNLDNNLAEGINKIRFENGMKNETFEINTNTVKVVFNTQILKII